MLEQQQVVDIDIAPLSDELRTELLSRVTEEEIPPLVIRKGVDEKFIMTIHVPHGRALMIALHL
jgi:hypothetical protein